MKRWRNSDSKMVDNQRIDHFLKDIETVCVKHGLSIAHEDNHGAFVVEEFDAANIDWLFNATDSTKYAKD